MKLIVVDIGRKTNIERTKFNIILFRVLYLELVGGYNEVQHNSEKSMTFQKEKKTCVVAGKSRDQAQNIFVDIV